MSASSDIEKLFDHFGGDANAYQEIGRENEARSARTRWPLLVTLDLTQPTIPAIGQRSEATSRVLAKDASREAADPKDTTPKDAASVTRAKAPLFTRSHRRDIPPVVVATPSAAPQGASRFGALEAEADSAAQAVPVAAVPPRVSNPAPAPTWAQSPTPAPAYASAPTAPTASAAPARPASILGKLFTPEPVAAPASPQTAAPAAESAPLQSVFDRLRGTPGQTFAASGDTTRAAVPAPSNSWLVNGPRRS
jgi:hypothetical protein